ncbi:SPOR domain-containing protein [Fulvivirga sediminis]|uniref:SPOR domain-containing protein n=1 Tax=Fulvivirga sediminis TaxID=2803949 RepID=A0A937JXQ8_9BACT|nr:SPOR domain-containing protein [Fulvivirga sediminis]MBL3655703.1 hypothetical protein [Fulvivirga sediminis]
MAKKKKDEIDENDELHQENDNINDADDNFGLPDVEFEPLDRSKEDDPYQEEEEFQEGKALQGEEEFQEEETNTYQEESEYIEEKETVYYEPEANEEESWEKEEESAYEPGSYTPPHQESSVVPKILGVLAVVLVAAIAVWYFMFYQPQKEAEEARIAHQQAQQAINAKAEQEKAEKERLAQEQAEREAAAAKAAEDAKPKIGTIETISSRTGRYYVVIASALDGDLAMDHAKKLSKQGLNATIIEPFGKSKFHRIAIESKNDWTEAQNEANDLKAEYGDGVWVIRY